MILTPWCENNFNKAFYSVPCWNWIKVSAGNCWNPPPGPFYLFDACALLLVGIVGQLEVLGDVVVPGRLLDLDLLGELEDFLLQLGDGLFGALRVRGAILTSREGAVGSAGDRQRRLAQAAHLQPVDLKNGMKITEGFLAGKGREMGMGGARRKKSVSDVLTIIEAFCWQIEKKRVASASCSRLQGNETDLVIYRQLAVIFLHEEEVCCHFVNRAFTDKRNKRKSLLRPPCLCPFGKKWSETNLKAF